MSILSAYSEITGRAERAREYAEKGYAEKSLSPAEDASSFQGKLDWLQAPRTIEMMSELMSLEDKFVHQAIEMALKYPEIDHEKIIQKLIQAHTVSSIVEKYGTSNKPIT